MISYELGRWNLVFIFALKGSVFPRAFVWAASSSALAVALHMVSHTSDSNNSLMQAGDVGPSILSGFSFILGFLIVFRSQQAHARWWNGLMFAQHMRLDWINAVGILFASCKSGSERRVEVLKFKHKLARLMSLLHASGMAEVCTMKNKSFELIDTGGFDAEAMHFLQSESCHDRAEVVLQWILHHILCAESNAIISLSPPVLARVYTQLGDGMLNLTNARKISEVQMPFPLVQMITVMLLFHGLTTPLVCAASIQTPYWSGLLCFVVVFSFWTINYIATELEMPFGDDDNDLPMQDMQRDVNMSLVALFQERATISPEFHFDEEVDSRLSLTSVNLDKGTYDDLLTGGRVGRLPAKKRDTYEDVSLDVQDVHLCVKAVGEAPGARLEKERKPEKECKSSEQCQCQDGGQHCRFACDECLSPHTPVRQSKRMRSKDSSNQSGSQVHSVTPATTDGHSRSVSRHKTRMATRRPREAVIEVQAQSTCCLPYAMSRGRCRPAPSAAESRSYAKRPPSHSRNVERD